MRPNIIPLKFASGLAVCCLIAFQAISYAEASKGSTERILSYSKDAHPDYLPRFFNKVVNAIYKAEGGKSAKKAFGILSVPCDGYEDCRQVCYNTVRNNYYRWKKGSQTKGYLQFLADRYAPVNCENDNGTNQYWLNNVVYFMRRD